MQRPRRWLAFPADAFSAQVRTSDIEDQLKPNLKHNICFYWNSLKIVLVWGRGEQARGRGDEVHPMPCSELRARQQNP